MTKPFWCLAFLSLSLTLQAQTNTSSTHTLIDTLKKLSRSDSGKNILLEEAIVYSSKFVHQKKDLSQTIDVISARSLVRYQAQNTGDLLRNTGNIFIQKSQQGGGSPVLRGFEASRILLIVDGVKLNNAIYRAGHLQNIMTVDQNMLERAEVLYGPSSTLFGSDALGGVIHLRTQQPKLSSSGKTEFHPNAFFRHSTVNKEKTMHVSQQISHKKWGWLHSFTYSDFGDMRMGGHYTKRFPDFGRRTSYIETINQVDQLVHNSNDRLQRFSGYRQWDFAEKLLFKNNENNTHQLNVQHSNSGSIPRYDRLQDTKNFSLYGTQLRWAEWYYGPQTRSLISYDWANKKNPIADEWHLNISFQDIKESRQQREFRASVLDSRREHIQVAAFNFDALERSGDHEITFGIDGQFNYLKSVADRKDLITGLVEALDSRYPNGKNRFATLGVYVQHQYKMKKGKWVLNDGIRFQTHKLYSTLADNHFFHFPFTVLQQNPKAITGNMGFVYNPDELFRISMNLATGFRAPNIDDAARIFESSSSANRLVVPNPHLKPENTYNLDMNFRFQSGKIKMEMTGYYTLLRHAIALAPFQLLGQDSVLYHGSLCQVVANQNVRRGYLRGFNYRATIQVSSGFSWETTISNTYGRYKLSNKSEKPMDHIPPLYGKSSLAYQKGKIGGEFFVQFNGWKHLEDYNLDGEDNAPYATAQGMPSWVTLNLKGSFQLRKNLLFQAGLENILDRNYRYFASGISAPGRNLSLSLRANF